jgi:hypothetical protein
MSRLAAQENSMASPQPQKTVVVDVVLFVFGAIGTWAFLWFWSSVPHVESVDAIAFDVAPALSLIRMMTVALLGVGGVLCAMAIYRRGCLIWRPVAYLGAALFVLVVAQRIVSAAMTDDLSNTTTAVVVIRAALASAATVFAATVVAGAAGWAMWRKLGARRGLLWTPQPRAWISLSLAALRGHFIAGIALGVVIVFALTVGSWFGRPVLLLPGAGAIAEGGSPAILYVFSGSLVCAFVFEFGFRMFGIGFVVSWTKRLWLGVAITSALYALALPTVDFGSAWFMSPSSAGVTVMFVVGILFGVAVLRFGTLTSVTASYVLTSCILSVPLIAAGGALSIALSVAVLVLPALVALPGAFMALSLHLKRRKEGDKSPVTVDIVGPEALSKIAALREPRHGQPGPSAFLEEKSVLVLTARRTEDFIGYIAVRKAEVGPSEVLDVFVREDERRQYTASKLLHEAREILKVEGRRALRATVDENDVAARAFCDASGLESSQVIVRSEPPGV